MRVGIQGWGSEGDLRPLVALAARLRQSGHAPQLVLTPVDGTDYGPVCRQLGIPMRTIPGRMDVTVQSLARDSKSKDPMKVLRAVLELTFLPFIEAMYEAASDLCATSDVVIGGSACFCVKAATLVHDVPFAAIHLYPGVVPTSLAPPHGLPNWRWLTRPGWAFLRTMMDMGFRAPGAKLFAAKGLPCMRHALPDLFFSDRLNLLAASPALWPPAADWSDAFCVSGDFVMPESTEAWAPSTPLREFLHEGPSPVLLSLGSMEHMAPERALDLLVASARKANVRAIVQTKTMNVESRDGDVFILPWAPHRALAALSAAVVHHGGAGTTHAALRAGKAAVIVPFIFEQQLWGKRAAQIGAAGAPLSFWKATPTTLAARIQATLGNDSMRQAAQSIGTAMLAEDGTGTAMRRLEALTGTRRPTSRP